MSTDDEDIKFRDQCAIQVMTTILSSYNGQSLSNMIEAFNKGSASDNEYLERKLENLSRFSYKVASVMRKTRLTSFT